MFEHESSIEKIVREYVPGFVIGTSHLVERYHTYKLWSCHVHYKNSLYVTKPVLDHATNTVVAKNFTVAEPDFVLNDDEQMQIFSKAIFNADHGLPYDNPFLRNEGWYIEVFGDYWHDFSIIGISKEQHETQLRNAYEKSGNHVLILWECDIVNHWEEYCRPAIDKFVSDFKALHNVSSLLNESRISPLSDRSLACLNQNGFYNGLSDLEKESVLDELVNTYSGIKPCYDESRVRQDWLNWKRKCESGSIAQASVVGNILLNYFVRSRFDARVNGRRSINEIWADKLLMRTCIDWQLRHETGVQHANRFLAAMEYRNGFRNVSNLNQSYVYMRCKQYATLGGIFYDPCAGWGGRMLGAYALGMKYVAIDANVKLVEELKALSAYIGYDAEIYYGDSSDPDFVRTVMDGRKADLVFTCPPYWNEEYYSSDPVQSNIKCDSKKQWYKCFFVPMVMTARSVMSEEGKFILSCDEKIDLKCLPEAEITKLLYFGFNEKREDPYYMIGGFSRKEESDYVKCELCGECMKQLHNHVVKIHGISIKKYNELFLNANISSEASKKAKAEANGRKYVHIENHHYNKRYVYLMPDGSYASKSDQYKRAWNVDEVKPDHVFNADEVGYVAPRNRLEQCGTECEDYVVCRICGEKKGNLSQHIRKRHGMTAKKYIEVYNAPVHSRKVDEALSEASKKKWQTQFANGTSTPAVKREHVHRNADDATKEVIERYFLEGYTGREIARAIGTSEVTITSRCKKFGIEVPSVTLTRIRKAVKNGAEMNLETATLDEINAVVDAIGKGQAMLKYGVERDVFNSWLKRLSGRN